MQYDTQKTEFIRGLAGKWKETTGNVENGIAPEREFLKGILEPTLAVLKESLLDDDKDPSVDELFDALCGFKNTEQDFYTYLDLFYALLGELLDAYMDYNPAGFDMYSRELSKALTLDY